MWQRLQSLQIHKKRKEHWPPKRNYTFGRQEAVRHTNKIIQGRKVFEARDWSETLQEYRFGKQCRKERMEKIGLEDEVVTRKKIQKVIER